MVPGLLGLLGATTTAAALAPALRVLNWPFLALTIVILGRAWYLQRAHGRGRPTTWAARSRLTLIASTALSAALWGLRFAGVLGQSPL